MITHKYSRGFVALMSVLVISAVILMITVTAGASSFHARSNALQNEFKRQALSLAEACVNVALLYLRDNYNYNPTNQRIDIGSDACYIESVTAPDANFNRVIRTWAEVNGSFSSVLTSAVIQDPTLPPLPPPPACSISITPSVTNAGQSVWLSWATSTNAQSFVINNTSDGSTIAPSPNTSGQQLISPTVSTTYNGEVEGLGGTSVCSASVTVQPPPDCADVVMMLDRTGSMSATDLSNERAAAKGILNLYDALANPPQVGVGRFGDEVDGGTEAEIVPAVATTPNLMPNAIGSYDSWGLTGTSTKISAVSTNDGDTSFISGTTQNSAQTFFFPDANLPVGSTIQSVAVRAVARETNGDASLRIRAENGIGIFQDDPITRNLTPNYTPYTRTMVINPFTGLPWTLDEVNNWTTRFGVIKTNSGGTARITHIYLTISYTSPAGWLTSDYGDDDIANDGDLYRAIDLATTQTGAYRYTHLADAISVGATELNGPRHIPGKGKVLILVSDGTPSEPPNNGSPNTGAREAALDAADTAKLSGVEIFTIFYGTNPNGFDGHELLAALATGTSTAPLPSPHLGHQPGSVDNYPDSPSGYDNENNDSDHFFISPSASIMANVFDTIGKIACPAAAPPPSAAAPPPPPPPLPPPPNISIGSWKEV